MPDGPDDRKNLIAGRLREARLLAGLSQGQVAKLMGLHRPTISQIEAGDRNVSAEEIARFAELYEVGVAWLAGSKASENPRMELAARELAKLKPDDLDALLGILTALRRKEDAP